MQTNNRDCIINEKNYQEPAGSWNIEFLAYFLNYQRRPNVKLDPTRPFLKEKIHSTSLVIHWELNVNGISLLAGGLYKWCKKKE